MKNKKKLGFAFIVLGIFIFFICMAADIVGIGQTPDQFGTNQMTGAVVGLVLTGGGIVLMIKKKEPSGKKKEEPAK